MTNFTDALHEYLLEREREDRFSGVVLITQASEQVFAHSYGYASRAWKVKNTLETRFDNASVTKAFTAVSALQLIEQGLLTFQTRAVEFLGLQDTTIPETATVYHLLTHTSGMGDYSDEEDGEDYEDLWKTLPNYSMITTADFLPLFDHKPPKFAPGEGCRYCNAGYQLLGLLIEKASGMTYRDYVRGNIFQRAGMHHSDFFSMDRVAENVAEGCDPIYGDGNSIIAWKKNIYSYSPIGAPDGGAHVTVGDLDSFLRAVHSGELLSAELTRDYVTPKVLHHENDRQIIRYGYGWEFTHVKAGSVDFYEKDGISTGVSAIMRHYPAQDMNVLMLSNMEKGVWEPIEKIHALLFTA